MVRGGGMTPVMLSTGRSGTPLLGEDLPPDKEEPPYNEEQEPLPVPVEEWDPLEKDSRRKTTLVSFASGFGMTCKAWRRGGSHSRTIWAAFWRMAGQSA